MFRSDNFWNFSEARTYTSNKNLDIRLEFKLCTSMLRYSTLLLYRIKQSKAITRNEISTATTICAQLNPNISILYLIYAHNIQNKKDFFSKNSKFWWPRTVNIFFTYIEIHFRLQVTCQKYWHSLVFLQDWSLTLNAYLSIVVLVPT